MTLGNFVAYRLARDESWTGSRVRCWADQSPEEIAVAIASSDTGVSDDTLCWPAHDSGKAPFMANMPSRSPMMLGVAPPWVELVPALMLVPS